MLLQQFDHHVGCPAVRTLVIAILHQSDRGLQIPLHMIVGYNRNFQIGHHGTSLNMFGTLKRAGYAACAASATISKNRAERSSSIRESQQDKGSRPRYRISDTAYAD
jgi:hypothetical protein